jgi:hypothetical protein
MHLPHAVGFWLGELRRIKVNISETKSVTVPELALIAVTRGAIGFGAGLLLADKLKRERRKVLGWSLFLTGLASTVPIAMHVFGKKQTDLTQHGVY